MAKQGYIKLYRQISDTAIWTDSDKIRLWLWCLFKCNFKETECLIGNQIIQLEKGQFVIGRKSLELEFNKGVDKEKVVSGKTLYRWLEIFKKMKMLSIKKTNKYSIITVLNWNKYQGDVQQMSNRCPTDVQQVSTREECIKNDKNDKELNTSLSSSEIDEIVILWNSVSTEISNLSGIKQNSKRMESVKARVAEYSYSQFLDAISNVKSSSFLTGKNYKNWKITFDWMIRPNNFPKVLEGNYTDRKEMADETNKRDVAKEYGVKVV